MAATASIMAGQLAELLLNHTRSCLFPIRAIFADVHFVPAVRTSNQLMLQLSVLVRCDNVIVEEEKSAYVIYAIVIFTKLIWLYLKYSTAFNEN